MIATRHTPGPWTIERLPLENDGEAHPTYRISGETTLFLHVSPCSDGYVLGQNEANVSLIAAAPELLDACVLALKTFRDLGLDKGTTVDLLEKTIRKATSPLENNDR